MVNNASTDTSLLWEACNAASLLERKEVVNIERQFVEEKNLSRLCDEEFKKKVLNIERQADIKVSSDWHPTNWNEVELGEQEVDFVGGGSLGGGLVQSKKWLT